MGLITTGRLLVAVNKCMNDISKNPKHWVPAIVALLTTLVSLFTPELQHAVATYTMNHPSEASSIAAILITVANMWESPNGKGGNTNASN